MNLITGFPRSGLHRIAYNVYSMIVGKPVRIDELEQFYPRVSKGRCLLRDNRFVKSHACAMDIDPDDVVIHTTRNPLDIVVSLDRFFPRIDLKNAILYVTKGKRAMWIPKKYPLAMIGNWNDHVKSFLGRNPEKTLIVRYEDYGNKQMENIAKFFGLVWQPEILEWNTIKHIKQEEKRTGAKMAHVGDGKIGKYKTILSVAEVEKVIISCSEMMERMGYDQSKNS